MNTKYQKLSTLLAIAMLGVAPRAFPQSSDRNLRVAVYDFDQKAGGNVPSDLGKRAALLVTSNLVTSGAKVDIITRDQIERLLKEQNLQFSSLFDPKDAVEIGKLLTADAIITGSVEGQASTKSFGLGPLKKTTAKATIGATAQLVSIATGRILIAPSIRRDAEVTISMSYNTNSQGNAGAQGEAIDKAVDTACATLASQINSHLSDIPRPAGAPQISNNAKPQPIPASSPSSAPQPAPAYVALTGELGPVIRVQANHVTFSLSGESHRAGEVLQVKHVEFVPDPRNGKQIPIGEAIGTVTVTEISDGYASGSFSGDQPPKVGDRIVPKAQSKSR